MNNFQNKNKYIINNINNRYLHINFTKPSFHQILITIFNFINIKNFILFNLVSLLVLHLIQFFSFLYQAPSFLINHIIKPNFNQFKTFLFKYSYIL